ncbi:jg2941 [Pararge aegeria aegeria]|uniref:Jg2941 protein n=1 Tax=Pararge aegeria aegeria TaxID=348720 RepID=A0A8S4SJ52_9NEOP|nr:jg2941 [Pararge aegeria aegeria]
MVKPGRAGGWRVASYCGGERPRGHTRRRIPALQRTPSLYAPSLILMDLGLHTLLPPSEGNSRSTYTPFLRTRSLFVGRI